MGGDSLSTHLFITFFIIFSKVLSDFIIDIPENQVDISLGCCQNRIKMTKMVSGLELVLYCTGVTPHVPEI